MFVLKSTYTRLERNYQALEEEFLKSRAANQELEAKFKNLSDRVVSLSERVASLREAYLTQTKQVREILQSYKWTKPGLKNNKMLHQEIQQAEKALQSIAKLIEGERCERFGQSFCCS